MRDTDKEVMSEYGEVKYSQKTQDKEDPASGMVYRRMVEITKARESMREAGGGGSVTQ